MQTGCLGCTTTWCRCYAEPIGTGPTIVIVVDSFKHGFDASREIIASFRESTFNGKFGKSWMIWVGLKCEDRAPHRCKPSALFPFLCKVHSPIFRPMPRARGHAVGHSPRRLCWR